MTDPGPGLSRVDYSLPRTTYAHGDVDGGNRHDVKDTMPTDPTRTKRGRTKKSEKDPPQKKHGPPAGSLILVPFCGVTVTSNKLANLPICSPSNVDVNGSAAVAGRAWSVPGAGRAGLQHREAGVAVVTGGASG